MNKTKFKRTPAFYKVGFHWLKVVDSLTLANCALNFETAMRNFFKVKIAASQSLKVDTKTTFLTQQTTKKSVRFKNQKFKLPKIGFIKLPIQNFIAKI